jgi:hypothetical protein
MGWATFWAIYHQFIWSPCLKGYATIVRMYVCRYAGSNLGPSCAAKKSRTSYWYELGTKTKYMHASFWPTKMYCQKYILN